MKDANGDTRLIDHYILHKSAKPNLLKTFGVKRITCFGLDFSGLSDIKDIQRAKEKVLGKLKGFECNPAKTQDLSNFRYAEDSMFA